MTVFANSLARRLHKNNVVNDKEIDIYAYGIELIFSFLFGVIGIILLGALLNQFLNAVVYVLSLSALRAFSGGYHADRYWKCFIFSILTFATVLLVHYILPNNVLIYASVLIISACLLMLIAPTKSAKNPKTPEENARDKYLTRLITITFVMIALIGLFFVTPLTEIAKMISFSVLVATILVVITFLGGRLKRDG